jgi:hypothetical protein
MYDYAITLTKVHSRRLGSICTASLLSRRPYRWHCSQLQASFISCNMRCLHTCPPCHVNCSHVKVNSNRWTVRPTHLWHATQHCSCRRNVVASQSGHQGSAQEEVLQIQPGTKPRGQFKLAGSPFTFKGAMIYLGGRLFNCELGSTVGPGDQELLNGLLEFHHDATSKKGAGVSHFTVNQSPHGETRCFWIHRVDGSSEDFRSAQAKQTSLQDITTCTAYAVLLAYYSALQLASYICLRRTGLLSFVCLCTAVCRNSIVVMQAQQTGCNFSKTVTRTCKRIIAIRGSKNMTAICQFLCVKLTC